MTQHRLTELVQARQRGELERDSYWSAMQELHRSLRDYGVLLTGSEIVALEITAAGLQVLLEDGVRVRWDPDDLRTPPVVLLNEGSYEPSEWSVLRALGSVGGTVLDVGANIGWYSLRLASLRVDRQPIHAFEPIESTFRQLQDNVHLNVFEQRVVCHQFGLSDRDDIVQFYQPEQTGSVAASERPLFQSERQRTTECRIRRADDVVDELRLIDIELVKCDVEGGEFGFLRGAEGLLDRQRPTIMLELLRKWAKVFGYHPDDVIEWMKARGYLCGGISDGSITPVPRVYGDTTETNFLFVHRDKLSSVATQLSSEFRRVEFE